MRCQLFLLCHSCLAPTTGRTNGRKTKQVLTTARDRAMQLAADICNIPDFAWKVPASAKLKGITPTFSEEGKSTQVLQAPGSHDSRRASNAALTLVFVFQLLWAQIHQGFPTVNHAANKGYLTYKDMSFKRKVLHLKHNLLPIGWHWMCLFCFILLTPSLLGCWEWVLFQLHPQCQGAVNACTSTCSGEALV